MAAMLLTGDVDKLRDRFGVAVEVFGVPAYTAEALIRSASRFVPVEGELLLGR